MSLPSANWKADSGRGSLTPSDFLNFLIKKKKTHPPQRAHGLKTPFTPSSRLGSRAFTICILRLYSPEPRGEDEAAATCPHYRLPFDLPAAGTAEAAA